MHLKLKHLTSYRDKRLVEDGVSPATVARDFRIMKAVATYAPELGFPSVPADPFQEGSAATHYRASCTPRD